MYRVKDASEIDERREYKGGNDSYSIKVFCINTIHKSREREDERGEEEKEEYNERVGDRGECEEERDNEHENSYQDTADNSARDEASDDNAWWGRGHKDLINVSRKEFGLKECGRRIGKCIGYHREHDESGYDKENVRDAIQLSDA